MKLTISEQATQLNNYILNFNASTQHLEDKTRTKLAKIGLKMEDFISAYHAHLEMSLTEYASYLNHDALSPLTIVLGYAEFFRTVNSNMMSNEEIFMLNDICEMTHTLIEAVHSEQAITVAKRDALSVTTS